ncbi:MAG TPA: hypothetical protein VHK05_10045 [Candidatus Limnocylindrales bacterium]|nr:hypothetical protein [Candidatus Limnocylindrales bacterium]
MASDSNAPRSRRALLTAAAGAAGAMAASAALPLTAAAAPTPMSTEQDNPSTAQTSVTQSAAGFIAFKASTTNPDRAGLVGATGDQTDTNESFSAYTGVYGFAPAAPIDFSGFGSGVWGDSPDVGVAGSGFVGVRGDGAYGMVAAGFTGGGTGLLAWGGDGSGADIALDVRGKVKFSRSGRVTILSGRSTIKVNLVGVTTSSRVFAVLHSNRSGRYVRAVVPTTGSFTIYLNTTVTANTFIAWFVIN